MHGKASLYFCRSDILSAAPDNVLLTVDKCITSIGLALHHISGMKPPAVPCSERGRIVLEISTEQTMPGVGPLPPQDQFTRHAIRHRVVIVINDIELHTSKRASDGAAPRDQVTVLRGGGDAHL